MDLSIAQIKADEGLAGAAAEDLTWRLFAA